MKTVLMTLGLCLLAHTAPAAGTADAAKYVCELKKSTQGNWLPEALFLAHVAGSDEALISDPIILHYYQQPIKAKVTTDNSAKLSVRWDVRAKSKTNQYGTLRYRASYFKKTGKLTLFMEPSGYSNKFSGSGACKTVD